jgi:hypothetical protein
VAEILLYKNLPSLSLIKEEFLVFQVLRKNLPSLKRMRSVIGDLVAEEEK